MAMKSLNVLVVEDDELIGLLLADILASMGHVVCAAAATQAEAVDAARRHRPDLMIVDVKLRAGDGISAVMEILSTGPVPHVFLSGDTRSVLARRPDAFVVGKPFRQSSFAKAIDSALKAAALS